MNSQSLVPGYLVAYTDRMGNTKRTTFFDSNLLTARKAALTLTESIFNSDSLILREDVETFLIEADEQGKIVNCIARISQRCMTRCRTFGGKLEPTPKEGMMDHYLAIVQALNHEYSYYKQHGHSLGFGSFEVSVRPEQKPRQTTYLSILFDALPYVTTVIALYNTDFGEKQDNQLEMASAPIYCGIE